MKLVTCGLPYANGKAHVGHLRTYIPADVYVRYLRLNGEDVIFICGSDCHGTPIVINAEQEGVTPEELVETYHNHFKQIFKSLRIEFDFYGRTDKAYHHEETQKLVKKLLEKGYIYPKEIELAYCPKCERFLPDRYVEGICPYCGSIARGDECDQGCGRHLEPGEIKDPKCKICGSKAVFRKQKHYFFKLTEFKDFLIDFLSGLKGTENALNYAKQWAKNLRDWCITRNLNWGVKFPGEEGLVVYVWVDAPIGYISFTKEACNRIGCDWQNIWLNGGAEIIHFIGLDIVYHHCIFWPAMLKGAEYSLPSSIVASGMVKIEGKTFSKSRGYVVWIDDDYLKSGFEPDYLRYYIVSYTSHQKDLNFSWEIFKEKVNKELIATLGNFLYRVLLFAWKNFKKVKVDRIDPKVAEKIREVKERIVDCIQNWDFKGASDAFMDLAGFGNVYFQNSKPWDLIKENRNMAEKVVATCLQIVKALIIFSYPVLPNTMERISKSIGLNLENCKLSDALILEGEMEISKPEIPFKKIEDDAIERLQVQLERRFRIEQKPEIDLSEFSKMEIRVGKVIEAEKIEGSSELLKLIVDLGHERRQIVAGLATDYKPSQLVGKLVLVLTNLIPKTIMGIKSEGMILATKDEQGLSLIVPDREVKVGSKVQ
ncbi:methionine--tRNA ligase [Archaeoglobales archaeon]|nr:MAG: methionine--tRNA ligase [Archaeoglobales archaeon]